VDALLSCTASSVAPCTYSAIDGIRISAHLDVIGHPISFASDLRCPSHRLVQWYNALSIPLTICFFFLFFFFFWRECEISSIIVWQSQKPAVRVLITGAAGQIAYSLIFQVARCARLPLILCCYSAASANLVFMSTSISCLEYYMHFLSKYCRW
jgi:hypothetical protein